MRKKAGGISFTTDLLLNRNLLNTALMTATLESSGEELVEDSLGCLVVDETTRKYQYVGIVVLTNEMSNLLAPCQTSKNK